MNRYLRIEEKKILINSFIYGNFNYCPLVWYCSKNSQNKIENIRKRALGFLLNDYESDYKTLLKNCNTFATDIRRLRTLALETFETLNDLNPASMKNIFSKQEVPKRWKNDFEMRAETLSNTEIRV